MTDQEIVEVVQAKINGRKIQIRVLASCGAWRDAPDAAWAFCTFEYRVKPDPRVRYFLEVNGHLIGPYGTLFGAQCADDGRVVEFIENVK